MGAASPSPVHPYVQLATDTIDAYVRDFRVITPPDGLFERHPALRGRAGVFVSLKMRGELRGCIGTIEPAHENLALEIIENAISAATKDPRFRPVVEVELPELVVSVDILTTPERVAGHEDLDVRRDGVIVKSGTRRGRLLADMERLASVDEQVEVAPKKGGIGEQEPVELYRFTVEGYC